MGELKDHNWVQKVAFDFCIGSQRRCFTGLKISNNFISLSVTTLALSNTHTPGFPDPEAPDKQEVDRRPAFCMESGSDTQNRHTKVLAPTASLSSAHFSVKENERKQKRATSTLWSPWFSCDQDRSMF